MTIEDMILQLDDCIDEEMEGNKPVVPKITMARVELKKAIAEYFERIK